VDYDLIIIAGEPSGDEHASSMLKNLFKLNPKLKIAAVCGPKMKKAYPMTEILSIDKLSIMGFIDVLKNIVKLFFIYRQILSFILKHPAKIVLFVDYPGMNLKLAKELKEKGFKGKLWHYIAPTAWAWKKNRVKTLSKNCDELFCILPFEESFFKTHHINAHYIGHPLISKLQNFFETSNRDKNLLALLPGSREHEIKKNLPFMLQAAHQLKKENPQLVIGLSVANLDYESYIKIEVAKHNLENSVVIYPSDKTLELMLKAHIAIAKSGTCILELALLGTPTIVIYAISKLDIFIAQRIFKINLPFYSLPNLILNKEMFKELYGSFLTLDKLVDSAKKAANNLSSLHNDCSKLRHVLGTSDPGVFLAKTLVNEL
jgi:lipid-A-disaccharide synthase